MCVFGKFYRDIFRGRGEILPFPFKKIVRNARFPWKTICSAVILAKILSFPRLKMRVYSGASDFVLRFFMLSLSLSLTFSFSFSLALTFFTPSPLFCLFCLLFSYRTCLFAICFFPSSPLCKDRAETRETSHKNKKTRKKNFKTCRSARIMRQSAKARKKCAENPAVACEQCAKAHKKRAKNVSKPLSWRANNAPKHIKTHQTPTITQKKRVKILPQHAKPRR